MRFIVPPEVPAVNDRLLVSMNHLGQSSWHTLHGIQDQDHSVIIVKSVKCQSEGGEERRSLTYLRRSQGQIYISFVISHGKNGFEVSKN